MTLILYCALAAYLVHESGHLIVGWLVGLRLKSVGVGLRGIYIRHESGYAWQHVLTLAGGPLASFLMASLFWMHPVTRGGLFALANLMMGAVNLLPFGSSDGMQMVDETLLMLS